MSEKKIDLIAQLLAKAESTTPEEAEALMEHAARLMAKYAIDQATIDERRRLHGQTSEQIVEKHIVFEGVYSKAHLSLGTAIVFALGTLRPLQSMRGNRRVLYIVGYESDVAQAEALINSLVLQATVSMKQWWDGERDRYAWEDDSVKRTARLSFVTAFGQGAASRIQDNRRTVIAEASTGTDLVLIDRKSRVDEHVDGMSTRKSRSRASQTDRSAYSAGHRAGQNANTGERAVSQGRGLTAGRS